MTMSKVNAHKNILTSSHDILITTANNYKNNNKNIQKYINNKRRKNNNNNNTSKYYNKYNKLEEKKNERKNFKCSDSNKIYEVVEAKKCIETQIYVQTQREGGAIEASIAAFPLEHPWPNNTLITTKTTTNTTTIAPTIKTISKRNPQEHKQQQAVICDDKIDTVQWCAKLRQTWRRISSRTWCSIDASLWHDAAFRIIVMLFVAAVAISGTAEVSAVHRSTHKHQADSGLSKNVNEIPFGFNDLVNSNANTNTNTNNFDYANTVAMSTTNVVNDSSATGSDSYSTISVTAMSILSSVPAMEIPSGSLQKVSHTGTSTGSGNGSGISGGGGGSGNFGKGINRNSIEIAEENRNSGPYFDKSASKNVTALLGKTAYLNCRVKNLGNKTVSTLALSTKVFSLNSLSITK